MSSYQQLEIDEFPSSPVNWKQLLFLRTWEGVGLTTVFYYVAMIVELFVTLFAIVIDSAALDNWSILPLILKYLFQMVVRLILIRIVAEIFLSIFAIRASFLRNSSVHPPQFPARQDEKPAEPFFVGEEPSPIHHGYQQH